MCIEGHREESAYPRAKGGSGEVLGYCHTWWDMVHRDHVSVDQRIHAVVRKKKKSFVGELEVQIGAN